MCCACRRPSARTSSSRTRPSSGLGYIAPAGPGHEVLQRRGDRLQGAVHRQQHPPSMRQGGLPAYRGRARHRRRSDPARQPLHPGRRRHSRPRPQRQVRAQARFLPRDGPVVRRSQAEASRRARGCAASPSATSTWRRWSTMWSHKQLLEDRVAHAGRGRTVRPPAGLARLDRRAAPLRAATTRSSIRGGATATTTGAPPTAAGGSTISWPRRPCPAPSGVIASTSTRATGSRRPTTCR